MTGQFNFELQAAVRIRNISIYMCKVSYAISIGYHCNEGDVMGSLITLVVESDAHCRMGGSALSLVTLDPPSCATGEDYGAFRLQSSR